MKTEMDKKIKKAEEEHKNSQCDLVTLEEIATILADFLHGIQAPVSQK